MSITCALEASTRSCVGLHLLGRLHNPRHQLHLNGGWCLNEKLLVTWYDTGHAVRSSQMCPLRRILSEYEAGAKQPRDLECAGGIAPEEAVLKYEMMLEFSQLCFIPLG